MKTILIKCWVCGDPHALYWYVNGDGKKMLAVNCSKTFDEKGHIMPAKVPKRLWVTPEYRYLIDGPWKPEDLPEVNSPARKAKLQLRGQQEMMVLLKKDHERGR